MGFHVYVGMFVFRCVGGGCFNYEFSSFFSGFFLV